jgi:hypothetical protein
VGNGIGTLPPFGTLKIALEYLDLFPKICFCRKIARAPANTQNYPLQNCCIGSNIMVVEISFVFSG